MYTNTIPNLAVKAAAIAVLLAAAVAQAAGPSRDAGDAQARYQKEVAVCDSGQSQQDMQTCRAEARNALAEAQRGKLDTAPQQLDLNAVKRCQEFSGDDRTACETRMRNPTHVEGSVKGGGVLRESVEIVPAK